MEPNKKGDMKVLSKAQMKARLKGTEQTVKICSKVCNLKK